MVVGGTANRNTLQIEPTVMDNVTFEDPVMQSIFFLDRGIEVWYGICRKLSKQRKGCGGQ